METEIKVLILDIADNEPLTTSVSAFFNDRPVTTKVINDVALFATLSCKKRECDLAVALVNSGNAHLVRSSNQVPTFVFRPHTYSYKKLYRFYREQGGDDGPN
ncbi:hypothetical protein A2572_04225 [Candidatus Collierbacteria bacterium RIFOXYD1_FULL_40_9]|uniref:Uncharacterized protein n=1 Tax=Candidatus Collierbacteria bacterium RIFOXYD1_FULL_40_9 TaxID=1817731 RepID=A0A1F5FPN2_9BACT|nr:MAG: hypothetical protein A2572_04225 [Candidatus Collierbacteria bacterium RIFOXYD1_FULL_40_9]